MREPKAVIVGSGRHGSGYIAAVLSAAGVPCGHEQWWNPHRGRVPGLAADSSWCALPFLDWYGGAIWHQWRHPLATVSSLVKLPMWGQYLTLAETITGPLPDDPMAAAVRATLLLNARAEHRSDRGWAVEAVDAELVQSLAAWLQFDVSDARAEQALASVEATTNYHGHGELLGWADLEAHVEKPDRDELLAMALRYGYER